MPVLKVNGNRVLVRMDSSSGKTAGGLFVPETSEKEYATGTVVDAPSTYVAACGVVSSPFSVGDRVLVDCLGARKVEVGGETLHVLRHEDVVGTLYD